MPLYELGIKHENIVGERPALMKVAIQQRGKDNTK